MDNLRLPADLSLSGSAGSIDLIKFTPTNPVLPQNDEVCQIGTQGELKNYKKLKNIGCLYLAFGRPYLIQALNSIKSLRKFSPSVPVCVLTNTLKTRPVAFTEWDDLNDKWIYIKGSNDQNRMIKTDLLRHTPFSRTLYIDCDTEILADITPMFNFLDHWDICLRLKEVGYSPRKEKGRQVVLDGKAAIHELPHWNSGVILFASNSKVEEFFTLWNHFYDTGNIRYDQVSLVEAAFRSSARILSLDGRWNSWKGWGIEEPEQTHYILHYMHDIDDRIASQLINLDRGIYSKFETDSNSCDDTASFVAKRQQHHLRKQHSSALTSRFLRLLKRFRHKLRAKGITTVWRRNGKSNS